MDFQRAFTRPLLIAITENGGLFAEILATRAETDPALAAHMLEALQTLRGVADIDAEGSTEPKIIGGRDGT